jgi:hypothetical protein
MVSLLGRKGGRAAGLDDGGRAADLDDGGRAADLERA